MQNLPLRYLTKQTFQTRENPHTRKTLHLPLLQQSILQIRQPSTVCPRSFLHVFFPLSVDKWEEQQQVVQVAYQYMERWPKDTFHSTSLHADHTHQGYFEAWTNKMSLCRHKRTHDRGDGVDGNFSLSGEEEEQYSGEDQLESLDDASPTSENGYVAGSLDSALHNHQNQNGMPPSNGPNMHQAPQQYNSLQTLSMPMTISHPQAINAGGMM